MYASIFFNSSLVFPLSLSLSLFRFERKKEITRFWRSKWSYKRFVIIACTNSSVSNDVSLYTLLFILYFEFEIDIDESQNH